MQPLGRVHPGGRISLGAGFSRAPSLTRQAGSFKIFDKALQRFRPAVENQILAQLTLLGRDFGVRRDVHRVDNRHIQASLHRMVEHHAV